ncbi:MAG TPA: hypothetical protein VJ020_02245 [Anaerolineales bacterium]|nr:hypothetical protein [Anaerolineales bacterium]
MKTPDWTEPAHPITTHELSLWRKQRRVLWITFVILPLLVSSCMWSAFLSPRRILRPNDLLSALNLNIWGLQLFLGIWLGVIVTSRAATLIARERETRNWALLKTTPHIESEILSLKAQAIFYDLRWPISLVFSLRALSIVGSVAAAPLDSVGEAAQAAIFVVVFCAELLVSLNYNCVVGATASAAAGTTASATGLAYMIHGLAAVFIFAPLWWRFIFLDQTIFFFAYTTESTLWSLTLHYASLSIVQLLLIGLGYSVAARFAERESG